MKIKYLTIATVLYCQSCLVWAQGLDQSKMDRDLKIAEDIVSSLIKNESDDGKFYASSPKATYIPGFGVMIDMSTSGRFYSPHFESDYNYVFSFSEEDFNIDIDQMVELEMQAELLERQAEEIERQAEIVARENERIAQEHKRALEQRERELEREMERLEREREREEERRERAEEMRERYGDRKVIELSETNRVAVVEQDDDEYTYRYSYSKDEDDYEDKIVFSYEKRGYQKEFEDLKPLYERVMVTFFTDYADLIGQLRDDEQIMLVAKSGPQSYGQIHFISPEEGGKYSGAVTRKDIADYKAGRIARGAFEGRINFVESKATDKKAADLELMASIFQRLYKTDLATTYYITSPIVYERLKSFGVIYKMRMFSSTQSGRGTYRMITQDQSNLSRIERDELMEELYPQFVNELKQNIIDYGKTIQSLDNDESILFQVRLGECRGCDIPNEINVMIENKVLADLEAGRISKTEAFDLINVSEIR